jgi:hypothetical protein
MTGGVSSAARAKTVSPLAKAATQPAGSRRSATTRF